MAKDKNKKLKEKGSKQKYIKKNKEYQSIIPWEGERKEE